jgi:DUF1680 family protein
MGAVRMGDGFWKPRMDQNATVALPLQMQQLRESGVLSNFLRVYGESDAQFQGMFFADSDLYKWLEAASWALQSYDLPELEEMVSEAIAIIEPAQDDNGYLNTYYQKERAADRWSNVGRMHELYCAGHLFQAAVAHHRATGGERLLSVARRLADHICDVFGPGREEAHPGHPEVEMGLVELYRETGERRYLDMAGFFIDHVGGKDMREILGHAVRALYFCCGMTDYYVETGEPTYLRALESLWTSMTETKMYVTGAVGGRVEGESFGREFELPNENAYAETCAAIASAMWNWRMLAYGGEARFADLVELTLYNSILSGVSLDGTRYFYENPHASNGRPTGDPWYPHMRRGVPTRQRWFPCACCPPNVARTLASLPTYFYSTSDEGVWVHLYDSSTLDWRLPDGTGFALRQRTRYPWDGRIDIELSSDSDRESSLYLRIPEWCQEASITVDGYPMHPSPVPGTYYEIRRVWQVGSRVTVNLEMPPVLMVCNPMAAENRCSVALKRGPIVYCFEGVDNPGIPMREARLVVDSADAVGNLEAQFCPEFLGGVTVVSGEGKIPVARWGALYRPLGAKQIKMEPVVLRAIPYYAWDNRGPSEMTVWLQMERAV